MGNGASQAASRFCHATLGKQFMLERPQMSHGWGAHALEERALARPSHCEDLINTYRNRSVASGDVAGRCALGVVDILNE